MTHSAGGIVLNSEGKVLVVNQRGRSWSLPKGHVEEGEDELAAARREIYEETGVSDLQLVRKLGSYSRHPMRKDGTDDPDELKTITLFLFTTGQRELKPIDPHNPEARWVDKSEVAGLLTHDADKRFFAEQQASFRML